MYPQVPPAQVVVAFARAAHTVGQVPQWLTSVRMLISHPFTGPVSQSAYPALQLYPHAVPLQVALAFGGTVQAVHDEVPQVAVLVLSTHSPAQL